MPDRIGPLSYTHWVWLSVTDLAGKYDIITDEGFPHRGFSLSPPFYGMLPLLRYFDIDAE
jgi:hypothetical protein